MMPRRVTDQFKRPVCRLRKIHREAAVAEVAPELLAKQRLNIGFVVNDKNKQAHLSAPSLPVAAMRGRMILNSVNAPLPAGRGALGARVWHHPEEER